MKKENETKHNRNNRKMISSICLLLTLLSSGYFIYHILLLGPIEPVVRYFLIILLVCLDLFVISRYLKVLRKKKKKPYMKFLVLCLIYFLINLIFGMMIGTFYSFLSSFHKNEVTYSTSLLSMVDSSISSIQDLKEKTIGIISDEESIDGYVISQEILSEHNLTKQNDLEKYDDYSTMLHDLYHGEIDAMFISSNYEVMFHNIEGYENIMNDTRVLVSKEKKVKKDDLSSSQVTLASSSKSVMEPFTVLLMGVDSEVDGLDKNGTVNGDALILITFNPKTLNATMLSIPRDTYVPIACFKDHIENKLTHAAWYGENCMIQTIQNFTGITIDYYAKINFKGVVSLVDALGGIDVDVPKRLCTDDSNRAGEICIEKGYQHLNGEQALVLSRNRHDLANGDLGRGLNQQVVLQGMMNSAKNIKSINQVLDILDTVSRNMDTNFTTEQILSFYNIFKDILKRSLGKHDGEIVNIQQLYLEGLGQTIYDEGTKMALWDYIPNEASLDDIVQEMKLNLELEEHELIKSFDFSINEPYEKAIVGKNPKEETKLYSLLPNFIGSTQDEVTRWAKKNGVKVTFKTQSSNQATGTVLNQSLPAKKRLDKITTTLVITISERKASSNQDDDILDCSKSSNLKNEACMVPNFTKMTKSEAINWAKQFKNVSISFEEVSQDAYPNSVINQIVAQDIRYGSYLKDTTKITLTIVKEE